MPVTTKQRVVFSNTMQWVRFNLAHAVTVALTYGTYFLLVTLTVVEPYLSAIAAFVASLLVAFFLNEIWVYRGDAEGDFESRLARFNISSIGGFVLYVGVFALFRDVVGRPDSVALILGLAASTAWTLLVHSRWSWFDTKAPAHHQPSRQSELLRRYSRYVLLLVFLGLWLFCLVEYGLRPSRRLPREDYVALAASLEEGFGERDVIAFSPFWAERGRLWLGQHPVLGVRDPSIEDLSLYAKLWLVGVFEQDTAPVREALASQYEHESSERFGKLTLDRFVLPAPNRTVYDFWDEVDRAQVRVAGKTTIKCNRWANQRWKCPGDRDWHYVGRLVTDIDYNPRRCLWAHPVGEGPLQIEYSKVTLGSVLKGWHGIRRTAVGRNPSDVKLVVEIDDEQVGSFLAQDKIGYFPFEIDTRAIAGEKHTVRFSVSSKRAGRRHYCFEARTLEPPNRDRGGDG